MSEILTVGEFISFRKTSKKVDEEKVNESIDLAEGSDFMNALGGLYFDIIANISNPTYADLLNGSDFIYCDESYTHKGLKAYLADLAYSRYIYGINVNLTPFGAQQKFTQDSTGVDRNTLRDMSKQSQQDADAKFRMIDLYLKSEPVLFERYECNRINQSAFNGIRLTKL